MRYQSYCCNGNNVLLGSLEVHRYTGNIVEPNVVKSGFCSIQCTITFAGTWNDDHKIENIVKSTIVKLVFHCIFPKYKNLIVLTCSTIWLPCKLTNRVFSLFPLGFK